MNNNGLFDEHIKGQFKDYAPDVHPRIWENIITKKEKKRPAGFWFNFFNSRNVLLLGALLLVAGGSAYFLVKKSTVKNETAIAVTAENKLTDNTVTTAVEKNNTTAEDINTNNNQNTSTALNNKNSVVDIADNAPAKITTPVITAVSKSKIKVHSALAAMGQDDDILSFTKYKKSLVTKNSTPDIKNIDDAGEEIFLQNNFLQRLLFSTADKITTDKQVAALNKKLSPDVFLPDCPAIEQNAAGNKTYFEVYGGPDIAFRSLTDTANSAYLQKRKESTAFSSAFSAGLRYTRVFNNGVSIRTGINYSQINEKFSVVLGNIVQVVYIINANGDTTGSYTTTGTRYKTNINRYKTIDVPLVFGYEMGNGRLHTNINAGVIINMYSWQKGEVLDSANKPVSITTGKSNSPYKFKTNIGLGFIAGVSVYYKLNEKLHLLAEPYFRYNLSPMSKENLTLKQKYNTAGLRIGLRLDLR
jgi:hypothetical protein